MALFGPDPEEIMEDARREQERKIDEATAAALFATTEGQGISTRAEFDLSLDDPASFADGDLDEDPMEGLFL
jgi:hypothetical protein